MNTNEKIAKLAQMKAENPEMFIQIIKDNLERNAEFNQTTNALCLERTIGFDEWSYVIYNIPIDMSTDGKAIFTDDAEDARELYTEMNRSGIESLILWVHISPQLKERLQNAADIEDVMQIVDENHSERKVIACNKSIDLDE